MHAGNIEVFKSEKENITTDINSTRDVMDKKRENITKLASQSVILRERIDDIVKNSQLTDTRTAYALSLYSKITNISWDYGVAPGIYAGSKIIHINI